MKLEEAKKQRDHWDTKGPCPKCREPFATCWHSVVQVDEFLDEAIIRAIVRDEISALMSPDR